MAKEGNLIETYKTSSSLKKGLIIAGVILGLVLWFLFLAYTVGSLYWILSDRSHGKLWCGIHPGIWFTLALFVLSVLVLFITLLSRSRRNYVAEKDDRDVYFMEKGTHGTSHPATEEEKLVYFEVCDISETDELVFGQETEEGERVIAYKEKEHGSPGTRHVLAFAPSGGGKTYSLVLTNILQAIIRGWSLIIVDPDGSLHGRTSLFAKSMDCDTQLLNLANLLHSNNWDCIAETISDKTKRVTSLLIQSWSKIFMKNSQKQRNEDFWYDCAVNLLETVIGYAAYVRESYILNGYKSLFRKVSNGQDADKYDDILNKEGVTFPWCEERIYMTAEDNGFKKEAIKKTIDSIYEAAPPFTLTEVYNIVNNFQDYEKKFENIPDYHPGKKAYARYKRNNKDAVKDGAIQGAQMKFKIFDDEKLLKILSTKGIDLKMINRKRSVYYLAVPDNDTIMRPIASLFFSFFFRDAQSIYDEEDRKAVDENRENRCIPVLAMMDEFASLGVITGDEKMFGTIMSNVRKRKIVNFIICQYWSQLDAEYGEYVKDGIVANCSTKLCLGADDRRTMEEISALTGVSTVMEESHIQRDSAIVGARNVDDQMSVSTVSRPTYTPDEIGKIDDEVLVIRRGCMPFMCKPMPWTQHPAYLDGKCEETSYFTEIESNEIDPWEEYDIRKKQLEEKKKEKKADTDSGNSYMSTDGGYLIDETTGELIETEKTSAKNPKPKKKKKKTEQASAEDTANKAAVRSNSTSILDD